MENKKGSWKFWLIFLLNVSHFFNIFPFKYNPKSELCTKSSNIKVTLWLIQVLCFTVDVICMARISSEVTLTSVPHQEFLDFYTHFASRFGAACFLWVVALNMEELPIVLNILFRMDPQGKGKNLPFGWKKQVDENGLSVFLEKSTGKRTYTDPRIAFARDVKESLYDFKQRFDASTEALAVLNGVDLTNKKALVTGANSGIGYETARSLALHGCEVIFACRNIDRAAEAMNKIKEEKPNSILEFVQVELDSLGSVKNCANEVMMKYQTLDILICNAGIFGAPFGLTQDNYEQTFQINFLSHFYLVLLLKPLLVVTHSTRIIFLASESHRFSMLTMENMSEDYMSPQTQKNFTSFMAYNDAKLCNVMISSEFNRRWAVHGVTSNSVHPGNMVSTGLSRHSFLYKAVFSAVRPFTKSLQQAAATTIWGATAHELNGVGGLYLNNCWLCSTVKKAEDPELAKRIWNMSVEMIERKVGQIPTLRRFGGGSVDIQEDLDQVSGGIQGS